MAYTKEQKAAWELARYHRRRSFAVESLGGKCAKCGTTLDLQIDHIDPATKEIAVGKLWSVSEARYLAEIEKCQLLCGPCHREKTAAEQRKGHGTLGMAQKRKCPCPACKAALKAANARWKATYRAKQK